MNDPEPSTEPAQHDDSAAQSDPRMPPAHTSGRVDRWVWAVRLAKTRADAAQACRGGHVRVNDRPAKPATAVREGDEVQVRLNGVTRVVDVTRVIDKRVGAQVARRCYTDRSPEPTPQPRGAVLRRDKGAGRPTKRDRRQIEQLRREGL
ncbi:ribosome-associated heat shock protein Hsp15 [Streptomonospora salina]|uniref:Ribosome-associated heat shock protein Hsp15 n=2 Tax=Streptomonospora salina TaxID=104205 RepID=A0A841EBB2_9ACTN|nr:ribosome-associated heat shock protein Hsp15 [Streptomonospora salina]